MSIGHNFCLCPVACLAAVSRAAWPTRWCFTRSARRPRPLGIETPTGLGLALTQSVANVLLAMYAGPLCAVLAELFPTKVRFTALSIGYSLAVTIFGGFAPFIGVSCSTPRSPSTDFTAATPVPA